MLSPWPVLNNSEIKSKSPESKMDPITLVSLVVFAILFAVFVYVRTQATVAMSRAPTSRAVTSRAVTSRAVTSRAPTSPATSPSPSLPPGTLIQLRGGVSTPRYGLGSAANGVGSWPNPEWYGNRLTFTAEAGSGSYVAYPQMTIDLAKGFTILAGFRFTKTGPWQTVLDLGGNPSSNNIVLRQAGEAPSLEFTITEEATAGGEVTGSVQCDMEIGKDYWAIAQYIPANKNLSLDLRDINNVRVALSSTSTSIGNTAARTYLTNYIGKSNRRDRTYSNLEIFGMLVTNSVLADVDTLIPRFN